MESKKNILDFKEKEEEFDSEHGELITEIVSPFLENITKENRREYNPKFYKLSGYQKILVDSLIVKALFYGEPGSFKKESVNPKDISKNKDLKVSLDVAKKVFNRELKKIFEKANEGYIIPNHRIKKAKEYL